MAEKKRRKPEKRKGNKSDPKTTEEKHLDDLLDEGIDESFPASDPPSVTRRE